jgi:predicted DNA-binding transcriptional regulator YafY
MDRLERLINLVIALRETRRPMAAEEIRERVAGYGQTEYAAFRRMFERDRADLKQLGVPIDTARLDPWDDRPGYRIDPRHYDLPDVDLAPDELAALALALQATGLLDEAATGLRKLQIASGADDLEAPARAPIDIRLDAPHRDRLLAAQASRTPVTFSYRPSGRDVQARTVDPHALVHRTGRWYLVGHDHARGARRAFRLDRIVGEVMEAGPAGSYPTPPETAVDDVVPAPSGDMPDTAEVAASPEVAWRVARRARGGGDDAGAGWRRYAVPVGEPAAFLRWALEFGPDLVVEGPPALRQEAIARLRAAADAAADDATADRAGSG